MQLSFSSFPSLLSSKDVSKNPSMFLLISLFAFLNKNSHHAHACAVPASSKVGSMFFLENDIYCTRVGLTGPNFNLQRLGSTESFQCFSCSLLSIADMSYLFFYFKPREI
jgi:hypothetical protein